MNVTLPPADYRAIRTRYLGATNYRGSRIVADAGDRQSRVTLDYDLSLNPHANHATAAVAVTQKMGWIGGHFTSLVGGEYRDSYVWVFIPRELVRERCCACPNPATHKAGGEVYFPLCDEHYAACYPTLADA